jgi:hypothetical protein
VISLGCDSCYTRAKRDNCYITLLAGAPTFSVLRASCSRLSSLSVSPVFVFVGFSAVNGLPNSLSSAYLRISKHRE